MATRRTLLIIPARGGSKGIKDKNIADVKGRPLIAYTIAPALELLRAGLVAEAMVSTDSEKIKTISESLGIQVPFLRPEGISGDKAKSIDYVVNALDYYGAKDVSFDAVMILQPTSPMRGFKELKEALDLFYKNFDQESLISAYREDYVNDLVMYRMKEGEVTGVPLSDLHNKGVRRQEHGANYVRNGAIYLTSTDHIRREHRIISDTPVIYVMPKTRSVNVDNQEDLELLLKLI